MEEKEIIDSTCHCENNCDCKEHSSCDSECHCQEEQLSKKEKKNKACNSLANLIILFTERKFMSLTNINQEW